jgi:phosphoribosylformylglycinamidine synthase
MSGVNVLVLTGYGLNCDWETAYAFELAGATARRVHINALIEKPETLNDFQIMVFIGGFSWGDDHGAGVVQAVRMKHHLGDRLLDFIQKGNLVLGICNGFQTLVNLGLLPGLDNDYHQRSVALTYNDCGNFQNRWVSLQVNETSPCVFTRDMVALELPVRHGEGKFYADESILAALHEQQLVALRYTGPNGTAADGAFPYNPNGSIDDIAGICDPTGRVFGLMPHPEAYNHPSNHPRWPQQADRQKRDGPSAGLELTAGIQMLKNGVDYLKQS